MITEYHFPTPVYIQEVSNAIELNNHLEKNRGELVFFVHPPL